jgi:hypothetical protein
LIPALLGLNFLSAGEKWRLALGLRDLARVEPAIASNETFLEWLRRHRQPEVVIERFWHVVLVSALSETLDRIDVGHARKVFVDSFLRNRAGWEVWLPTAPLDRLYGETLQRWFAAHSVAARLSAGVARVEVEASAQYSVRSTQHSGDSIPISGNPQGSTEAPGLRSQESGVRRQESVAHQVVLRSGESVDADHVILAVPQNLVLSLLPGEWAAHPDLAGISRLETAPISSVHLWFDRPITDLRHATFVGRLSQWLFNRTAIAGAEVRELGTPLSSGSTEEAATARSRGDFYYQIVISASREVVGRPQEETIAKVIAELAEVWPVAREARLVHARLVTEHKAVVSMLPGIDRLRPRQQSPIAHLQLAGDWTQTGWPGTMEGAVRSGYLAAENVLAQCGRSESIVQPDPATAVLSKILFGL